MTDGICLSIVIPIYNAGAYLRQCLESLLASDGIEDTEIILVNDGSSDDSGAIAEEYAAGHSNITVFHKENGGPSAARNLGIKVSTGKYVFFCDADDTVDSVLFGNVLKTVESSSYDIILWDAELVYETWNLLMPKHRGLFAHKGLEKEERTYSGSELIETMLMNRGDFISAVWLGAYRRDYLTDNGFLFKDGIILEDELWAPGVFLNAESVRYIPLQIYRYRIHNDSIMNPANGDRSNSIEAVMYIYPTLYDYCDEILTGAPVKELFEGNLTKKYLRAIYKYRVFLKGYGNMIDKKRLWKKSRSLSDKILVLFLYVVAH